MNDQDVFKQVIAAHQKCFDVMSDHYFEVLHRAKSAEAALSRMTDRAISLDIKVNAVKATLEQTINRIDELIEPLGPICIDSDKKAFHGKLIEALAILEPSTFTGTVDQYERPTN